MCHKFLKSKRSYTSNAPIRALEGCKPLYLWLSEPLCMIINLSESCFALHLQVSRRDFNGGSIKISKQMREATLYRMWGSTKCSNNLRQYSEAIGSVLGLSTKSSSVHPCIVSFSSQRNDNFVVSILGWALTFCFT